MIRNSTVTSTIHPLNIRPVAAESARALESRPSADQLGWTSKMAPALDLLETTDWDQLWEAIRVNGTCLKMWIYGDWPIRNSSFNGKKCD